MSETKGEQGQPADDRDGWAGESEESFQHYLSLREDIRYRRLDSDLGG
jgi:hypothetical protein